MILEFKLYIEGFKIIDGIKFLINPTKNQLIEYTKKIHYSRHYPLRGILDYNDVYYFDASLATHVQSANILGLTYSDDSRVNVYINSYNQIIVDHVYDDHPQIKKLGLDEKGILD